MKINIFVVCLLTLAKTMAVTLSCFLLMILFFNDTLDIFRNEENLFIYIFLGIFLYSLGGVAYVFSVLLPLYFIDRRSIEMLSAQELFARHAPVITGITTFFCFWAFLIAGGEGIKAGGFQCNIFTIYVMAFAGLLFFEYQLKSAQKKASKDYLPHIFNNTQTSQ